MMMNFFKLVGEVRWASEQVSVRFFSSAMIMVRWED